MFYLEQKRKEEQLKAKEQVMNKIEDSFHKFAEKRIVDLSKKREKRGLRTARVVKLSLTST